MTVLPKLNGSNYVLRKGKGKVVVVHVNRMRKLPVSQDVELSDSHTHTRHNEPTIPPCKQHRTRLLKTCLASNPWTVRAVGIGQIDRRVI